MKSVFYVLIAILVIVSASIANTDQYNQLSFSIGNKCFNDYLSLTTCDGLNTEVSMYLKLPGAIGFSITHHSWLNNINQNADTIDETDIFIGKAFSIDSNVSLNIFVKYFDMLPITNTVSKKILLYNVHLSCFSDSFDGVYISSIGIGYLHYANNFNNGGVIVSLISISPYRQISVFDLNSPIVFSLQWNSKIEQFNELLTLQLESAFQKKIFRDLTWNILDIVVVYPLTLVHGGDPRKQSGNIALSTGVAYTF